jgi:predicted amidophosphoribosyltransferase
VAEVEEAWALAPYAGPLGATVARAKREGDREVLRALAELLAHRAHDLVAGGWFAAVVPAPSPWTRRLRRGFAPGHVLADAVARTGRLPVWSVLGVRPGQRQSALSPEARPHNLAQRLSCRPLPPVRLLLVDDVITSGTTVARCAAMLKAHGASSVWALALCDARRHIDTADSSGMLPPGREVVTHAATTRSNELPRRTHS